MEISGPLPLPLIGNLHQLAYKMFIRKIAFTDAMREWTEEHGPLLTFWFGPTPTINICDYATAVDAMVKKGSAFADRSLPYLFKLSRNGRGIMGSNGSQWLEQRRFALHTLRNFGIGRNLIEERIMYEFEIACEGLDKHLDTGENSIDPHNMFVLLVGNIINRMLFTERFEQHEEENFFALKKKLDDIMKNFRVFDMLINEWNVKWPLVKQRAKYLMKPMDSILEFLGNQIEQRKREISNGSHVLRGEGEDFVDAFLLQMEKEKKSGAPTSFEEEALLMTLLDLWAAGQETTTLTINWAFSYLLMNPQVTSRVEEELLRVTGGRRPLSISDRPSTIYYNAVLTEIHRCAAIVHMNLSRDTSEDTVVGSYLIPKGTPIAAQISLVMSDEKLFTNQQQFNPDRFLNGNKLDQMVVPFGLGKRACPGESLAQAELYLITANLLLRYKITADSLHMPSTKAHIGIMRRALPYRICFERR